MSNWLLRVTLIFLPIVIAIVFVGLIFLIVVILNPEWETEYFPYIRDSAAAVSTVAMVLATLVLAYATFIIISGDRRREERAKKESLLKELINWVEDITIFCAGLIVTDRTNVEAIRREVANRLRELNELAVKGEYIQSLANRLFPNNTDLLKGIQQFRVRINRHTKLLALVFDQKVKAKNELKARTTHCIRLRDDCLNLIRLAARTYTEIK